jgi:hypothetical protein
MIWWSVMKNSNTAPTLLKPTTLNDDDLKALESLLCDHNLDILKFINDNPGLTHTAIEQHTNCGMLSTVAHQRINIKTRAVNIEAHCFPINGRKRKHCWYLFRTKDLMNTEAYSMAEKGNINA